MIAGSDIKVVEGKSGWLFLEAFGANRYLATAENLSTWKEKVLPKHVANYSARARRVAERGIGFLVVIAPETSGIYPEYLPDGWNVEMPTAGECLASLLSQEGVNVICPAPMFRASKALDLYCRLDSHWSFSGAYLCYQLMMERIRQFLPVTPIPWQRIYFGASSGYGDLGVHVTPERKGSIQTVAIEGYDANSGPNLYDHREKNIRRVNCAQGNGKAVIFRDSFSNALTPFLERTFAETVFIAPAPTMMDSAIDAEKPDIVILEVAERALFQVEDAFADWSARSFSQEYLELATNPTGGRFQVDAINHLVAGSMIEAISSAAVAVALENADARVHNLAWALYAAKQYKLCHVLTEKFAKQTDDQFLFYLDADAAVQLGDFGRAEESINSALAKQPNNALYLFLKGAWLKNQLRLEEAFDALERSVGYAPLHHASWVLLIEVASMLGRADIRDRYQREFDCLSFVD
jgi:alginate O-acetyltransferase complex protein AlgJ